MSHDEYIVSQAFLDAVERRVDERLHQLGIDATSISARGARIDALERASARSAAVADRIERYEDRARLGWKILRAALIGGGAFAAGSPLIEALAKFSGLF